MTARIENVTLDNAQEVLVNASYETPVLIDFWADWCQPCKNLMPILEKLAEEYAGQFILAKVDTEAHQMLASQFGVRSLPTVVLMKDGAPVDGFTGAQTEPQVREFLSKHLPKAWVKSLVTAQEKLAEGAVEDAFQVLQEVPEEAKHDGDYILLLAQTQFQRKRYDEAESALDTIPAVEQGAMHMELRAQIELAKSAPKPPELEALEAQHASDPDDTNSAFALAKCYGQHGYHEEALELLLVLLRGDREFADGEAKRQFLDVLAALGKGDPIAVRFQRKLYTLMH